MAIFFKRHRTPLLFSILLVAALLLVKNMKVAPELGGVGSVLFSSGCYVQKGFARAISGPVRLWKRYCWLLETEKENAALQKEIRILRQENVLLQESRLANLRFRELLDFKDRVGFKTLAAEIVGTDPSFYFKTVSIDKGVEDGVRVHMPVLGRDGIVGRILKVADSHSVVLLLIDQNFALDAVVQGPRARGVVEGTGAVFCTMKYVPKSEDIRPGDVVVSSGVEGVLPKGLLIGEVVSAHKDTHTLFQDVRLRPAVDFAKLEEVLVIVQK